MTSFPKDFPRTEIQQILNFANGTDNGQDRVALAIYGLIGHQLGKLFPNAQLTSQGHDTFNIGDLEMYRLQLIRLKQQDEKFAQAIDFIRTNQNIENDKLPEWLIPVIYRIVELTMHSIFQHTLFGK